MDFGFWIILCWDERRSIPIATCFNNQQTKREIYQFAKYKCSLLPKNELRQYSQMKIWSKLPILTSPGEQSIKLVTCSVVL